MVAVREKVLGNKLMGEALMVSATRWLLVISKEHVPIDSLQTTRASFIDHAEEATKQQPGLEISVPLPPAKEGSSTCSFLQKFFKAATTSNASSTSKADLARQSGSQLEESSLLDLLIPSLSYANEVLYDVDEVMRIVEHISCKM